MTDVRLDGLAYIVSAVWLSVMNFRRPLAFSPDSGTYLQWSDGLLARNFDVLAYLQSNDFVVAPYFYVLHVVLISALRRSFADGWTLVFHILNVLWVQVLLWAYWQSAKRLGLHRIAIALGFVLFTCSADLLIWPHYMLTDSLYMALVALGIWAAIGLLSARWLDDQTAGEPMKRRTWLMAIVGICLLLSLARPSSPPIIFCLVLSPLAILLARYVTCLKRLLVFMLGVVLGIALLYPIFMLHVQAMPAESRAAHRALILNHLEEGGVIHDRPETWIDPPRGYADMFMLYLIRLCWFFSPYAKGFSLTHVIVNSLHFGLIAIGLLCLARTFSSCSQRHRAAVLVLAACTLGIAMFHSGILIDYDWRYRAPLVMPLVLAAVMGFSGYLDQAKLRND